MKDVEDTKICLFMEDTKICLFCEHFYVEPACQGWSVLTPGWDLTVECDLGHWEIRIYNDYANEYRVKLQTAKDCSDWKPVE